VTGSARPFSLAGSLCPPQGILRGLDRLICSRAIPIGRPRGDLRLQARRQLPPVSGAQRFKPARRSRRSGVIEYPCANRSPLIRFTCVMPPRIMSAVRAKPPAILFLGEGATTIHNDPRLAPLVGEKRPQSISPSSRSVLASARRRGVAIEAGSNHVALMPFCCETRCSQNPQPASWTVMIGCFGRPHSALRLELGKQRQKLAVSPAATCAWTSSRPCRATTTHQQFDGSVPTTQKLRQTRVDSGRSVGR